MNNCNSLLCIYHGNCADGFGAAWVVRRALGAGQVEFYPGVYQDPPPDVTDRHVLLVDFTYKRDVLEEMAETARAITILDHHDSARKELADLPPPPGEGASAKRAIFREGDPPLCAKFDMDRSGAGLTWDFFFPEFDRPMLINHIEDRDLWRFQLSNTRKVQAALFSYPYDFDVWDDLILKPEGYAQLLADGEAIERKHFKDIREYIEVACHRMDVGGVNVPALNAPYFWSSDACHIMCEGEPFAVCYWHTPKGWVFSLRSGDDGINVADVAKHYGGGGHVHASGFRIDSLGDL